MRMAETAATELEPIGRPGLRQWGGYVSEERHPKLIGTRGPRTYREMLDNSAIIGAALWAIETLLSGVEWREEPADESDEALRWADFLRECRTDMEHGWQQLIREALSCLGYGWALVEPVYKVRRGPDDSDPRYRSMHSDGRIGWRRMQLCAQESLQRWEFASDETLLAMEQRTETGFSARIPMERALLFRVRAPRNNPEGRSLLRNAYRSWYFAKRLEEIEAIGCERDLAGLPVAELPPEYMMGSATADQKALLADLKTLVQQVKRDEREGLIIPASEYTPPGATAAIKTGFAFRLQSAAGSRQFDVDRVIRRHESRILMTFLAEFMLLGTEPQGTRSLADSKTSMFAASLGAVLGALAEIINGQGIARLMQLNAVPRELWPRLVHGDIEAPDPDVFARSVLALVNAGVLVPTPADERHVRQQMGLPAPDTHDEEPDALPDAGDVAPATGAETVADTALNGAQVASLVEIVRAVAAGQVPRDAAQAIIAQAFRVTAAQADAMLGEAGRGFVPTAPAQEQA